MKAGKLAAFAQQGQVADDDTAGAPPAPAGETPKDFSALTTLLTADVDGVVEAIDGMDADVLTDSTATMESDDRTILLEDCGEYLSRKLQTELRATLPGAKMEELLEFSEALEADGVVDDAVALAGWLYRLGEAFAA